MPWKPGPSAKAIKAQRKKDAKACAEQIRRMPYCGGCGTRGGTSDGVSNPLTAEHLVPVSQGGTADQGLTTLCLRCNIKRYRESAR